MLRLVASASLLALLTAGIVFFREAPATAYAGMPKAYQDYWEWVSRSNRDGASFVVEARGLLQRYGHLRPLYLRIAQRCPEGAQAGCREALQQGRPDGPLTALYQAAGLALLEEDSTQAVEAWQRIAGDPGLDPTLARLVVDRAGKEGWLDVAAGVWQGDVDRDSTRSGARFGLALAALRQNEWAVADAHLQHLARTTPEEPDVYRELGRIYYSTGRHDLFEPTLRMGIDAAIARHDFEAALILLGNLGLSLLQGDGDLGAAEALFTEALAQSKLIADPVRVALNQYRLASVRVRQHRYTDALALLDSALVLDLRYAPRHAAEVKALRGTTEWALFRFSDAERTLQEAIAEAQGNPVVLSQAAVSLTQLRYRMGRFEEARAGGLEALASAQQHRLADAEVAIRMVLGDVERRWGNFEGARAHYADGLERARISGNPARQAELMTRLGQTLLEVQDAREAKRWFDELQGLAVQEGEESARRYEGMGRVYHQFGNYEQAIAYFDGGLAKLGAQGHDWLRASLSINRAWALIELSRYAEARETLARVERLRELEPPVRYELEVAQATVLLAEGADEAAIRKFEAAQRLAATLRLPVIEWHLLHGLALAHGRLGHRREAERYFRQSIATVEAMRDNLYSGEQRASFIRDKVTVYKNFSAFLEAQGRVSEALHFSERARSRSLADLLYSSQQGHALDPNRAEDRVLEAQRRRQALARTLEEMEIPVEGTTTGASVTRSGQLRREYLRADSMYHESFTRLGTGLFTALARPATADSVRSILREDEALVFYDLRERNGYGTGGAGAASVAYVVTRKGVTTRGIRVTAEEVGQSVRVFRDQISTRSGGPGTGWERTGARLHSQLVEPVLRGLPPTIRHLHLVPEGHLHYLPFAALQDGRGQFLIERYTLSVTPSLSVLGMSRRRNPNRWRSVLAVADPTGGLPGTRREVKALEGMRELRTHLLVGERATQENVELLAEEADVLHIATHGRFIPRAPWSSHLELSGGTLTVDEIGRLRLGKSYLVTLSACETGLGGGANADVPPGDEWVGLNQAFLAAGAPTVMASLWPIDDRASSRFMTSFYRNLLNSNGKSWALAEVQRSFLRDARFRHPFYWAAFTVTGDPL